MPSRIEDYALIGDCETAALVARDGSIDWLCFPRFDSAACFAALLGTPENGRWRIAPAGGPFRVRRSYRPGTLVLDTEFTTDSGAVTVTDFMPPRSENPDLVRLVTGTRGRVRLATEIRIRFGYGDIVPWVQREDGGIRAIAGPDMLHLRSGVPLRGEDFTTRGEITVAAGERVPFVLTWHPSHLPPPEPADPEKALAYTEQWWRDWSSHCQNRGPYREAVTRSLITLKALTYAPTGGIVAAPTTSLPEALGGVRNWDYRFCWIRDAAFTLLALLEAGYRDEARAWREWLLRAVAGKPSQMHILYGVAGERQRTELEVPWLPGYENSRPVRVGNAAAGQFQLDVYGEVLDVLYQCRRTGLDGGEVTRGVEKALLEFLESHWGDPDEGIWEVRGPRRHFTHSKVMAWVAADRAVKMADGLRLGPRERWQGLRDAIHREVCDKGYDPGLGSFVQSFGSRELDASLLLIPLVGFLPPADPRVRGTVRAVEQGLLQDGLVLRYATESGVDGLPAGEGAFLPCSFWLADNYVLAGRREEARALFERLLALRNDVGLLSEEYDPHSGRLVGNFPQAFSHVGLVNTALALERDAGPEEE